jgi:hypothetical protein
MHPLAFEGNKSGCFGDLKAGDRFVHALDMRTGIADEFMPDGNAFVTWDDGSYGTINWSFMYPDTEQGHRNAKRHRANLGVD